MLKYDVNSAEKEFELLDTEFHGELNLLNPFPGLRPFGVDECHLFFGREGQVDEILTKLSESRFVTVLGNSGSGKSSLMYCGIIPILYGGFMTDTGSDWNIVVTRPGYSPLDNLAESLIQHDPTYNQASEEDKLIKRTVASAILRSGSSGLIDIARQYKTITGDNLFVLVDQFEEVFRFGHLNEESSNEAMAFTRLLMEAIEEEDVPIYVAITMRSDFIGESASYPGLTELINHSNYLVPQMTREQKRMAIEGPVAVGGGRIAPRLVKRILRDIGENQDQLPIMQHALMRTWEYWKENREQGELLDFRHYNAIGQISEALSQHADEAYERLSPQHKYVAEVMFKRLTEKGTENIGIRRPSTVRDIALIAEVDESLVIEVVDHFRQPGLSLLMPPANVELYSDSIIEISHESLMRIWTRLKQWVEDEDEAAQMYLRISEAAALYQVGRTGLWRPPDLQLALNWQMKYKPTRQWAKRYDEAFERAIVFLDTSRVTYESEQENQELLQKRMLRRARVFAAVLGIAAIIAILFGVSSLMNMIEADRQREAAFEAEAEAVAAKEIAEEQKILAEQARDDARVSEQKAIDAREQTLEALRQEQQALAAEQIAKLAEAEARQYAEEQTIIAEEARDDARASEQVAIQARERANNLLMLSLASALAGKSIQERDDNLRADMALQAYKFNKEYGGKEFDKYIYDALYFSLAEFKGERYNVFPLSENTQGHLNAVKSVEFSGIGNQFYSTGSDGKIFQWDLDDNNLPPVLVDGEESEFPNRSVIVSPNKKWLLSTSDSSYMNLYTIGNLSAEPVIIKGHKGFVRDAAFMPDNSGIVSVGSDRTLYFYDFKRSRLLKQLKYTITALEIDPTGNYIYAGTLNGQLVQITIKDMTEKILASTERTNRINSLDITHDGKWVAFGGASGYLNLFDVDKGEILDDFYGHTSRINDIAFSNNSKRLATASWDGTVQMWNMENIDDLPYYMTDHGEDWAWDVSFSPDDEYLLVGTNGKIKKWAVDNDTMAEQICQYVERNMTKEEWDRYVSEEVDYESTCENIVEKDNSL
ncbi:MAG: hypothetical protein ABFS32_17180 [Bacteroidota bacterium]